MMFKKQFFLVITLLLLSVYGYAATWADFEAGSNFTYGSTSSAYVERSSDDYYWMHYDGVSGITIFPLYGFIEIDTTTGARNTSRSMKFTVTGGDTDVDPATSSPCSGCFSYANKQAYLDDPSGVCDSGGGGSWYTWFKDDTGDQVGFASTMNRLTFWFKTSADYDLRWHHDDPSDYPENYNMHFGTYSRDPAGVPYNSSDNKGRHFYHTMNIQTDASSGYWTKVYIDNHPQQEVGGSADPGVGPTSWNYFEGFSRFYFKGKSMIVPEVPFAIWVDEFEVFQDADSTATTVATVAITRTDEDSFFIDWSDSYDKTGGAQDTYEIRYSTSAITPSNVSSATSAGTNYKTGDWENTVHADTGDLSIAGADTVYFAIQQTNANSGKWYFCCYELTAKLTGSPLGGNSQFTIGGNSTITFK